MSCELDSFPLYLTIELTFFRLDQDKLGLEFFNGSISALATDRFNSTNTFTKLGAASGLNQGAQCVGAILIA